MKGTEKLVLNADVCGGSARENSFQSYLEKLKVRQDSYADTSWLH